MSREHNLKIEGAFFDDVASGRKPFEIRKNDRGYQTGDTLVLREYWREGSGLGGYYSDRETRKRITYILNGWGLQDGYVALGLEAIAAQGKGEGQ
jgi:hypothetical protein